MEIIRNGEGFIDYLEHITDNLRPYQEDRSYSKWISIISCIERVRLSMETCSGTDVDIHKIGQSIWFVNQAWKLVYGSVI